MVFFLQTDDSNGDLDPGVLLTAQTITSETTSSTTTTQITKVTDQLELPSGSQWHAKRGASVGRTLVRKQGFPAPSLLSQIVPTVTDGKAVLLSPVVNPGRP